MFLLLERCVLHARYEPNVYNQTLPAEPDSGHVIKSGDTVADELAMPGNDHVTIIHVTKFYTGIMQPAALTQEYTACLQEGGVLVLGSSELDRIAISAAAESAQITDVDAGTDHLVNC
jgi:hypothetical protein